MLVPLRSDCIASLPGPRRVIASSSHSQHEIQKWTFGGAPCQCLSIFMSLQRDPGKGRQSEALRLFRNVSPLMPLVQRFRKKGANALGPKTFLPTRSLSIHPPSLSAPLAHSTGNGYMPQVLSAPVSDAPCQSDQ